MFAVLFTSFHLALYGIWKYVRDYEKRTRPDGHLIPWYATGGVGNAVGFTLVALAYGFQHPTPSTYQFVVSATFGVLVTFLLHSVWKRGATKRAVSLYISYLRTGRATLGGKLHLVYMVFVSSLCMLCILSWAALGTVSQVLFVSGVMLYAAAVVVDSWRGVL